MLVGFRRVDFVMVDFVKVTVECSVQMDSVVVGTEEEVGEKVRELLEERAERSPLLKWRSRRNDISLPILSQEKKGGREEERKGGDDSFCEDEGYVLKIRSEESQ